ncbi:DUF6412 domain-containing protein [Pseudonocardia acidicola]|uniref:Uncharacterized protein n=1 Tax=Pseudonocardia acidicola TaxID=2724939 RepID=A0ABX1S602_9PSEU|nr:DUF6412 domain-containing protein [Pseudonocardia acidicola]NMH96027.1 hypothetical protein [Pseudonocardia acidicola]
MSRTGTVAQALALLVLGYVLVAGEPGVVIGVLGAALWAWGMARHACVVLRATTISGPATAVRALRRSLDRAAVPRQQDPDAPGHTRARAPSGLLPAV